MSDGRLNVDHSGMKYDMALLRVAVVSGTVQSRSNGNLFLYASQLKITACLRRRR